MLVIIGLLLGGGVMVFEAKVEQMRRSAQQRQFRTIRAALYGFAMSNGRLPCPDTDYPPDGREDLDPPLDPNDGTLSKCSGSEGALPWVDLGVARNGAWGFPLRYRVDKDFADEPDDGLATFEIGDQGGLNVYSEANPDGTVDDEDMIAEKVVAVVVSYGPQGEQVWTASGFQCPDGGTAGFSAGESQNCDGVADSNDDFVAFGYRPPNVRNGFDDMLMWIPYPVLTARMVEAGVLP